MQNSGSSERIGNGNFRSQTTIRMVTRQKGDSLLRTAQSKAERDSQRLSINTSNSSIASSASTPAFEHSPAYPVIDSYSANERRPELPKTFETQFTFDSPAPHSESNDAGTPKNGLQKRPQPQRIASVEMITSEVSEILSLSSSQEPTPSPSRRQSVVSELPTQSIASLSEALPSPNTGILRHSCDVCRELITGPYVAGRDGKCWHKEHFRCAVCNKSLLVLGYIQQQENLLCRKDYITYFAPRCYKCSKPIDQEVLHALDKDWHKDCFTCCMCENVINSRGFNVHEGKPYCDEDFKDTIAVDLCAACGLPIESGQKRMRSLDREWHAGCFTCCVCSTSLEGVRYYSKRGKPYCKTHRP